MYSGRYLDPESNLEEKRVRDECKEKERKDKRTVGVVIDDKRFIERERVYEGN